ncbi:UbiA family prenyltransferase [Salinisphaera aquimarina]|uniref:UbiA family prenyltransferase n=1 Tax=Salinisphaera aquimarina TaxID=2094031 RepID=A0ABV7EY68_9GAMM
MNMQVNTVADPAVDETDPVPLVVDLDGTLVNSDLLIESAFMVAHRSPHSLVKLPNWLRSGKATLKAELARRADLGIADLPYNEALITFLRAEKANGRTLILATASNEKYAHQVAEHLGLFDAVLASDARTNLSGQTKLDALRAHLDGGAFDYAADDDVDRVIWRHARKAVLVNADAKLTAHMRDESNLGDTFEREHADWRTWARALRIYQWAKNGLIFVPLLAAHELADVGTVAMALLAFIAYSLLASSVYLLNDLVDLGDDRQHPRKRERPFASGRLPILHGALAIPVLILAAFVIALFLPPLFWLVLATYYVLTLAYSLGLKQLALLDVLTLAGLYTLRIIAGGAATGIELSFWLLALSMSIFLSLAMAKRCTELLVMKEHSGDAPLGRGYVASDLPPLRSLGTAAGYTSVVVLALYINSPDITDHYSHPARIWLLCPVVLYWISRIWLTTLRGQMHDDPIVFAARDTGSRVCVLLGALIMFLAL